MVNDGSHRISTRPSLESQTYSHVLRVPRKAPLPAQINKVSTDVMVRFPQGNWKLLIDRHVYQEENKYMIRAYAEIAFTFLCTIRSEKKTTYSQPTQRSYCWSSQYLYRYREPLGLHFKVTHMVLMCRQYESNCKWYIRVTNFH